MKDKKIGQGSVCSGSYTLFFILHTFACLVWPSRAADWPQWRGPDRTGHVTAGTPVPTSLPSEPKVIWRIGIGAGLASPVVAGGRVFYFANQQGKETIHAIDAG